MKMPEPETKRSLSPARIHSFMHTLTFLLTLPTDSHTHTYLSSSPHSHLQKQQSTHCLHTCAHTCTLYATHKVEELILNSREALPCQGSCALKACPFYLPFSPSGRMRKCRSSCKMRYRTCQDQERYSGRKNQAPAQPHEACSWTVSAPAP